MATRAGRVVRGERGVAAELRRAPLGILVVAATAALVGIASIGASLYQLLAAPAPGVWAATTGLVLGPTLLYLAYHLVRLAHWAWTALILLLGLLLLSSLARVVVTPGIAWAAVTEAVAEVAALLYLRRPAIRGAFASRLETD